MPIAILNRPYPKDPINEAVIHIATAGKATPENIQKFARHFVDEYPHQEMLAALDLFIDATGGAAQMKQQMQGFRLTSITNPDIIMVFPEGVAAARLAPYYGWEQLRNKAQRAWSEWHRLGNPASIQRIGVRYINRLDLPVNHSTQLELNDYLNFFPKVPRFSRWPLVGFVAQVTVPTDLDKWSVSLTSTIVNPPPLINTVSILLDIDIFRSEEIPTKEDLLWNCIDLVRPLKNQIFEACITDSSRKLFG